MSAWREISAVVAFLVPLASLIASLDTAIALNVCLLNLSSNKSVELTLSAVKPLTQYASKVFARGL